MHKPWSILQKQAKAVNSSTQVESYGCRVSVRHGPLVPSPGGSCCWDGTTELHVKQLLNHWSFQPDMLEQTLPLTIWKKWTDKNLMKTNTDLYLGQKKLIQQAQAGDQLPQEQLWGKALRTLVSNRLHSSQQNPLQRWRLTTLWAALARAYQQVRRRHYASLFGTCEAT